MIEVGRKIQMAERSPSPTYDQDKAKGRKGQQASDSIDSISMSRLCTPLVSWERTTHAMRMRFGKRQQ